MDAPTMLICPHPEGEPKNSQKTPHASWPLDTPGGRFHAELSDQAPVTREGQLIFFFQFLKAGARWQEFLRGCPLHYVGNRGSGADHITSLDPVAFPTIVMPKNHREAIRSRPILMAGVGRQVQSGGQRTVKVSVLHEKGDLIAQAVTQISKELHQIRAIT